MPATSCGVTIDAADAIQLADALARVTVEGWTQEQVDLALRVAWLAREGGLVVDHGPYLSAERQGSE